MEQKEIRLGPLSTVGAAFISIRDKDPGRVIFAEMHSMSWTAECRGIVDHF